MSMSSQMLCLCVSIGFTISLLRLGRRSLGLVSVESQEHAREYVC